MNDVKLPYQTPLRDDLNHQVRFVLKDHKTYVGCICRVRLEGSTEFLVNGSRKVQMIGPAVGLDESRELYNNPENHWLPFTEEDKAKW
jgi:hypothetical protein